MSLALAIERFGLWLELRGRKHTILDREGHFPYMERFYLAFSRGKPGKPFNLLLHRILRSDPEDLHDHPWWFVSLVLSGGYWEHTPRGKHWRGAASLCLRRSTDAHKIELDPGRSRGNATWTLVLTGPKRREWGFVLPGGEWLPWQTYIERLQAERAARARAAH